MEANRKWGEKYRLPFSLLCDTDRKVGLAYGACSSSDAPAAHRVAFVIDENGVIAEAHPKVDALAYPREQLQRLVPLV